MKRAPAGPHRGTDVLRRVLGVVVIVAISGLVLGKGYRFAKWYLIRAAESRDAERAFQSCRGRYKNYRSRDQFYATLKVPYLSPASQQEWAMRLKDLDSEMSESEVEKVTGPPDYAECRLNKERTREFSCWVYGVEMVDENLSYNKNAYVQLFFGPDGRILPSYGIYMQGIAKQTVSSQ
jgi:hypothetical protein